MIYKEYGRTGKKVSAVGFGGMRFSEEAYRAGDLESCAGVVRRAFELGVNYFDTAPNYCGENSQKILGLAFSHMPREKFYVSTKCGLWNAKDGNEARQVLEKSLKELGVEKINFYHLWCIKTWDDFEQYMKKGGIYEAALKAKDEGLIEHICFSTHMSGPDIAKVAEKGLFEGVTLGYNAVNFAYRREGVVACHKAGMGVVVMNPLGGGLIPRHPDYFSFIRRNETDSLSVSALKFIVSQPEITVALSGMSSVAEAEENVLAGDNVVPSTKADLDEMAAHLSRDLNALCTGCSYCDHCPVGVPIPKLMDSFNEHVLSGGKDEPIKSRILGHWGIDGKLAKNCVKCGKCEKLCTQKLPIIDRLQHIAGLY